MTDTQSASEARHTVTPHLVVRGAAAASAWYQRALGAKERGRIPVLDGRFMQIELRFGDSTVMLADEFPELGVVSPLSVGGTVGALAIHPTTSTLCGNGPWRREPRSPSRCRRCSGATATARSSTRSATAGPSRNPSATSRPRRAPWPRRRCSAASQPDPGHPTRLYEGAARGKENTPNGAGAFMVTAFEQRNCRHESLPPSPRSGATIRLRRLPLPTRRDRPGGRPTHRRSTACCHRRSPG
jgi:hypothetical protein